MSNEKVDLFDEEFGDLLGDLESTAGKKQSPVQKPNQNVGFKQAQGAQGQRPVQPVQPPVQPVQTAQDDEEEAVFVPFGTKIDPIPIPRFKASTDAQARISIISNGVLPVKMHFVEGIGSFKCFGGACCENEGLPKVRYVVPVVLYDTDKTGRIVSNNIELKALVLGDEAYGALATAIAYSGRKINDVDIIISCTDAQYQKMTFAADASSAPAWKGFSSKDAIVEKYKANKNNLYLAVTRKISSETYLAKKGFLKASASQQPQFEDISQVFEE